VNLRWVVGGSWEKAVKEFLKVSENKIYIKVTAKGSPAHPITGVF